MEPWAQVGREPTCVRPDLHAITAGTYDTSSSCQSLDAEQLALPNVSISCLGPLCVRVADHGIIRWGNRKAPELLAFLATQLYQRASHDELVDALWPEYDPLRADQLLYVIVWRVRQILDHPTSLGQTTSSPSSNPDPHQMIPFAARRRTRASSALLKEGAFYCLNADRCVVDIAGLLERYAAVEHAIAAGEIADTAVTWRAVAVPQPEQVLQGETFAWLETLRDRIRNHHRRALSRALTCALRDGDQSTALAILHDLLRLDPLDEEVTAQTMRLHLARGELAAAAGCYRAFRTALAREYGEPIGSSGNGSYVSGDLTTPSRELRALFALATSSSGPPTARRASSETIEPPNSAATSPPG